jgi:hypothetical protein
VKKRRSVSTPAYRQALNLIWYRAGRLSVPPGFRPGNVEGLISHPVTIFRGNDEGVTSRFSLQITSPKNIAFSCKKVIWISERYKPRVEY